MHIDDAQAGQIDDGLRNDLAIPDDYHDVGLPGGKFFNYLGMADALGLAHGKPQAQCGFFDWGYRKFPATALGPVRLRCTLRSTRGRQ